MRHLSKVAMFIFCISLLMLPDTAAARQGESQPNTNCMPGMSMPGCPEAPAPQADEQHAGDAAIRSMNMGKTGLMPMHGMAPQNFVQVIAQHSGSGTSVQPISTPAPMLIAMKGSWMLMFHANVFIADVQQTGQRGRDRFFSTNWFMPMAMREIGPGMFTVRAMLSAEPATVAHQQYPLLFQQGETAFGKPIADGQHPHDFFMELAALYDWKIRADTLLSFYFAPIGDPAMGPTAYGHRASAAEDPLAPLGHHQQDSTHVGSDVLTLGATYKILRVEGSGFHGREPDENRWTIEQGPLDSWSTRLTLEPGKNWSGQFSYARISSPEALFAAENQERITASVIYNRPIRGGNWASTLVWGRTRSLSDHAVEESYLLESTLRFKTRNYAWARIEDATRTNLLLVGENPLPPGLVEAPIGRVQAYTVGYDRDFDFVPRLASAIGAQFTVYGVPEVLQGIYGRRPVGVTVFARLRPFTGKER